MATIYQKENGYWYIQFRKNGKRHHRSLKTKDEEKAKKKLEKVEEALSREAAPVKRISNTQITWAEVEKRFKAYSAVHHAQNTQKWFEWALPKWMSDHGKLTPKETTLDLLTEYQAKLIADMTPQSVNDCVRALRQMANCAIRHEWLHGPNPFSKVKPLKEPKKAPRWLTADEIDAVLEWAAIRSRDVYLFFALGIYAGLRKNEILNAKQFWITRYPHGSGPAGYISVTFANDWITKSKKERVIPLMWKLRAILDQFPGDPDEYLIAPHKTEKGKDRYRFDIRKQFAWVCAKKHANVPDCTPHVLRHTFGSQLVQAGLSLYQVAEYMGHSDPNVTRIYAHLDPKQTAIDVF